MSSRMLILLAVFILGCGSGSKDDDGDTELVDADGDGVAAEDDCDDTDSATTILVTDSLCNPELRGEGSIVFESLDPGNAPSWFEDCTIDTAWQFNSTDVPEGCPNCTVVGQLEESATWDCDCLFENDDTGDGLLSVGIDLDSDRFYIYSDDTVAWEELWGDCPDGREIDKSEDSIELLCVAEEDSNNPLGFTATTLLTW